MIGGESDRVKRRIPRPPKRPVRNQCGVPVSGGCLIGQHGVYQIMEVLHRGKKGLRYVREGKS